MTARIYVACLRSHNAGKLHGEWIDVTDPDTVASKIREMLRNSPEKGAEEFAIHDFEGFGSYRVNEHNNITELCKIAEAIEKHGPIVIELMNRERFDIEEATQYLLENYQGAYPSLEAWAFESLTGQGAFHGLDRSLTRYFDFKRYAEDSEASGGILSIDFDGATHVFYNS